MEQTSTAADAIFIGIDVSKDLGVDADPEPGGACHGLPQALGTTEASRPGRRGHRGVQKNFPATLAGIAREQGLGLDAVEIWFADEARVDQKNGITRRWARRGTRPSAPQDQRYASTYIFGAVCPQDGKGAALVLPFCNTAAMNLHLTEIGAMVSPAKHAVLLLDQAGWHLSGDVAVPDNITLLPLPAKCPELNVMENVWQFMGQGSVRTGATPGGTPTSAAYTAFNKAQGSITRGGSALAQVTGARLTYANGMEAVRTIRADRRVEGVDPGIARATSQITVRFENTTLLAQAQAGTSAEFAMAFTIDAIRSLTITLHEVYLALAKTPIEGPAGVEASFDFRAAFNATATRMMTVVLRNQQAGTEYA